jgi:single-strand DNA-binding protein
LASRSVNKVILLGNLTRDAETKFTPSGTAVSKFSLATNRRVKDQQTGDWKDEADFHNVTLWQGENVANFLLKGKSVYLEGRLSTRKYDKDGETRYATEVVCGAMDVILLGGGKGDGGGDQVVSRPRGGGAGSGKTPAPSSGFEPGVVDEDEIPFILPAHEGLMP